MRVVLWIAEGTWVQCVDGARALLGAGGAVTLVHVAAPDAEAVATGAHVGLLGRRRRHEEQPALAAASREEAEAILALAAARLGCDAERVARRGRPEHEVIAAARGADLLVVARDGAADRGPGSIGPRARFVLDHAPCPVLLVPGTPGGVPEPPPGPHPPARGGPPPAPGGPPPPPVVPRGGPPPLPSAGQ